MSTMMMLMKMVVVVLTIVKTMVVIIIMSAVTMVNFTYALYSSNLSFWTKFHSVAIEINASFHMVRFVFKYFTKLESILQFKHLVVLGLNEIITCDIVSPFSPYVSALLDLFRDTVT